MLEYERLCSSHLVSHVVYNCIAIRSIVGIQKVAPAPRCDSEDESARAPRKSRERWDTSGPRFRHLSIKVFYIFPMLENHKYRIQRLEKYRTIVLRGSDSGIGRDARYGDLGFSP